MKQGVKCSAALRRVLHATLHVVGLSLDVQLKKQASAARGGLFRHVDYAAEDQKMKQARDPQVREKKMVEGSAVPPAGIKNSSDAICQLV